MNRRLALVATTGLGIAALVGPATAAPKTMSGTYTANGLPDPTPYAGTTCVPTLPTNASRHNKPLTVPAGGTLKMEVTSDSLDWSIAVLDSKGRMIACQDSSEVEAKEKLTAKLKTAGKYTMVANNFAGTPTATIKWSFTYGK
jgi:hypothetical protein